MTEELTAKDAREKTAKALKRREIMKDIDVSAVNGLSNKSFYYLSEDEKSMLEELGYTVEKRTKFLSSFDAQYSYDITEDYYVVSW